jgi:cholesterol transport system auxiliary component
VKQLLKCCSVDLLATQRQCLTQWAARIGCLLLLSIALSGCVGELLQSKVTEPQTYVLHANDAGTAKVAYALQLSVATPTAAPGLDTARIAVLRNTNQLDYYFGARWGGTAPEVAQAFLIALLQSQQGFKGVVAENVRVDADYLLELELRDFQAEYASEHANPVAHLTLTGTLINIKSRKPVATVTGTAKATAKDNRLGAVITAFQSAAQQASASLSEQLTESLGKQP